MGLEKRLSRHRAVKEWELSQGPAVEEVGWSGGFHSETAHEARGEDVTKPASTDTASSLTVELTKSRKIRNEENDMTFGIFRRAAHRIPTLALYKSLLRISSSPSLQPDLSQRIRDLIRTSFRRKSNKLYAPARVKRNLVRAYEVILLTLLLTTASRDNRKGD